jgi:hypothetical protein
MSVDAAGAYKDLFGVGIYNDIDIDMQLSGVTAHRKSREGQIYSDMTSSFVQEHRGEYGE